MYPKFTASLNHRNQNMNLASNPAPAYIHDIAAEVLCENPMNHIEQSGRWVAENDGEVV